MNANEIFAKNLKKCLFEKDISMSQFARQINVSIGAVSKWCNAKQMPKMETLDTICKYLGVGKPTLLFENDENLNTAEHLLEQILKLSPENRELITRLVANLNR